MKYRVFFHGTDRDFFTYSCEVEASNEAAAKRKAIQELGEVRGKTGYGGCVVNKR